MEKLLAANFRVYVKRGEAAFARPGLAVAASLGPRHAVSRLCLSLSARLELLSFGGTVAGKRAEQEELTQG